MESGVLMERIKESPEVIYEDGDIIVVNKPAGLQVHAARGKSGDPTLVDWLLPRYPEIGSVGDDPELRPGIVHRLDKDTSGVMVVARTQKAFEHLKSLFEKRDIKKTYLAVVSGELKDRRGSIDAPIGLRSGTLKRSVRSSKMAKSAVTDYRVLKTFSRGGDRGRTFSLLEVMPRTGRTHQIRVHLSSIGHPVAGDRIYGPARDDFPGLALHALSIEFTAPDGKRVKFEAEPPAGFAAAAGVIHT